jgi:hypothetical protein
MRRLVAGVCTAKVSFVAANSINCAVPTHSGFRPGFTDFHWYEAPRNVELIKDTVE